MGRIGTPRYKNEVGNKYGRLTVREFKGTNKSTSFWLCSCECGNELVTRGNTLRSGQVTTCGKCGFSGKKINPQEPLKRMYRGLVGGAKSRNLINELSFDDFVTLSEQDCYLCGLPPHETRTSLNRRAKYRKFEATLVANGVDRRNNDVGYTKENSVACCSMCNRLKSDFELEHFIEKIGLIYERQKTCKR